MTTVLSIGITAAVVGSVLGLFAAAEAWRASRRSRQSITAYELARREGARIEQMSRQQENIFNEIQTMAGNDSEKIDYVIRLILALLRGEPTIPMPPPSYRNPRSDIDQASGRPSVLAKEISHSLKTPLAHIEAVVAEIQMSPNMTSEVRSERLGELLGSITLCKSVLAAFGRLDDVSLRTAVWEPESINECLRSAHITYSRGLGKSIQPQIEVPDRILGYSNNYIVALLLPLLENAIEATDSDGMATISYRESGSSHNFVVINGCDTEPSKELLYEPGRTSKQKHDGLGLAVVVSLLKSIPQTRLGHVFRDGMLEMHIELPKETIANE
jgi:signal transduction histidine kinase